MSNFQETKGDLPPRRRQVGGVIFLDVDGVLNHVECFKKPGNPWPLCKDACRRFRRVVEATRAQVVLSSAWRGIGPGENVLKRAGVLKTWHEDKRTPHLHWERCPETNKVIKEFYRGDEIADWLSRHPEVETYAIVDDDSDMLPEQKPYFVQTSFVEGGLLDCHADMLIDLLTASGPAQGVQEVFARAVQEAPLTQVKKEQVR